MAILQDGFEPSSCPYKEPALTIVLLEYEVGKTESNRHCWACFYVYTPVLLPLKLLPVNDLIIYQVYPSPSSFPNTLLYSSQEEANTSGRNDKLLNQSSKTGFEPATPESCCYHAYALCALPISYFGIMFTQKRRQ